MTVPAATSAYRSAVCLVVIGGSSPGRWSRWVGVERVVKRGSPGVVAWSVFAVLAVASAGQGRYGRGLGVPSWRHRRVLGHGRAVGAAVRWPWTDRFRRAVPAACAVTCGDTAGTRGTARDGCGRRPCGQHGGHDRVSVLAPVAVLRACRLTCGITAGTARTATGGGAGAQPSLRAGLVSTGWTVGQ